MQERMPDGEHEGIRPGQAGWNYEGTLYVSAFTVKE